MMDKKALKEWLAAKPTSIRLLKDAVNAKGEKVAAKTVIHPGDEELWPDDRIRHHVREGLAEPVSGADLTQSHEEDLRRMNEAAAAKPAPPRGGRR
jgi:hypothetical protein